MLSGLLKKLQVNFHEIVDMTMHIVRKGTRATAIQTAFLLPNKFIWQIFVDFISNQIRRFAKAPHHQSSRAPNIMTANRDKNEHTK